MTRKLIRKEPIDSVDEALAAMHVQWGDHRTEAVLIRYQFLTQPRIERRHFCGPYDSFSGCSDFNVTRAIADQLLKAGHVKGTPRWGYTEDGECVLTERGRDAAFKAFEEHGLSDVANS